MNKIVLKLHMDNFKREKNLPKRTEKAVELSWMDRFRRIHNQDKYFAKNWFWDNFNWSRQSIWVGKFNKMNHLPPSNEQINRFLKKLVHDLDQYNEIKSDLYIKFYFSRHISTGDPDINYLLICNTPGLPEEFSNTLINITFEKYQVTEDLINKNVNFKNLINHYIEWNNFFIYYDLMGETQY